MFLFFGFNLIGQRLCICLMGFWHCHQSGCNLSRESLESISLWTGSRTEVSLDPSSWFRSPSSGWHTVVNLQFSSSDRLFISSHNKIQLHNQSSPLPFFPPSHLIWSSSTESVQAAFGECFTCLSAPETVEEWDEVSWLSSTPRSHVDCCSACCLLYASD